ncbi:MAG TPA: hypothetical protein VGI39_20975 [Polyangiaceae bacterium]
MANALSTKSRSLPLVSEILQLLTDPAAPAVPGTALLRSRWGARAPERWRRSAPACNANATVVVRLRVEPSGAFRLGFQKVRARAEIEALLLREHGMRRLADWECEVSLDYDTETVRGRTYEVSVAHDSTRPEGLEEAVGRLTGDIGRLAERRRCFAEVDVVEGGNG